MYRVSKVLNNNGVIAINMERKYRICAAGKRNWFWEKKSARDLKRRITAPGIL